MIAEQSRTTVKEPAGLVQRLLTELASSGPAGERASAPPISMRAVAVHLGLRLVVLDRSFLASCDLCAAEIVSLLRTLDGIWVPRAKGGGVIAFNPTRPITRQRFTVAHEIGHYLLSCPAAASATDGVAFSLRDGRVGSHEMERRMNAFAAELLMPEEDVRAEWAKWEGTRVDGFVPKFSDLAGTFEVSKRAMSLRLGELVN